MQMEPYSVMLKNMRGSELEFSIEKNGFEVLDVGNELAYHDFHDETLVQPYFRTLERLLKQRLRAAHVLTFRYGVS